MMERNELMQPVTMTDKYFYDIAVSLRILVDMFNELANGQQEFAVENVIEETVNIHSADDLKEYEKSVLYDMNISQLREEAKAVKLKGYSKMNKEELIDYLLMN